MTEIHITPRPGFTMTVDVRWARELFDDMERSGITSTRSKPTTDALYLALRKALKSAEPASVETLSWGPGKWSRTPSGDYVWRRHRHYAHRPMEVGPVLARIERLESREWKPWVYPYGEGRGNGLPQEVVYWRMPTRTLRDAQAVAQSTFVAQRKAIEEA